MADVHATGHAQADELKTLISITRPEHFVPIHGEYRHMVAHAKLAAAMGVAAPNIALCEDGDVITLSDQGLEVTGRVPAGYLYVDGIVGDVGQGVLRDRRVLAEEGVVVVVATVDVSASKVLTGPEIITRGWVYAPEARPCWTRRATGWPRRWSGRCRTACATSRASSGRSAGGRAVRERARVAVPVVPVVMEA